MKRLAFLMAALAVVIVAAMPGAASGQASGLIEGTVVNGTAEGGSVDGIPVTLRILRGESELEPMSASTDAEGRFRFERLETSPDLRYVAAAGYAGVQYNSSLLDLSAGPARVEVTVFETTTSAEDVSIRRASLALTRADSSIGLLGVLEIVTFVNADDRTYVGDLFTNAQEGGVLRFPLPQQALDVALDVALGHGFGPDSVIPILGGMLSRTPLAPGEQEYI